MSGPCHFVVFGALGHLVTTKLLPALYHLELVGRLDEPLSFVAFARRDWDTERWRVHVNNALAEQYGAHLDVAAARRFIQRFEYVKGDYTDPAAFQHLLARINTPQPGICENVVFYLAIPPDHFVDVVRRLDDAGLNSVVGQHRIVVEKPFGTDLVSARELNAELRRHYEEEQVYRIDHYLGKETVQNLLVFRFANSVIEPLWNRHYIDHVQITVAEESGIGGRASYFDRSGTLRDMVQNHLLQLLTLVAMEAPASLDADALRDEKVKVLRSIRQITVDSLNDVALRAQYEAGEVNGAVVSAYRDEPGVADNSNTESYVAIKFHIDNWRWRGVPFYLRSGKRLAARHTMVAIRFRDPPHQLFCDTPCENMEPNWLVFAIQPEESIRFELYAREPGLSMTPRLLRIDTNYRAEHEQPLNAYATLLMDVIEGDRSLFIRFDEVEMAWQVIEPVLRHWSQTSERLYSYAPGSWGPKEARALFEKPYQSWRNQP
ncbi:MAG: glucose-6-phosphate dehydrogenase [Proteobacteria bacterium]|nr:glucose-6-phosphate dehydrogenase [Pseudomonadota bacterium]